MHLVNVGLIANCEYLLVEVRGAEYCRSAAEPSLASNYRTTLPDAESDGKASYIHPEGFKVDG